MCVPVAQVCVRKACMGDPHWFAHNTHLEGVQIPMGIRQLLLRVSELEGEFVAQVWVRKAYMGYGRSTLVHP